MRTKIGFLVMLFVATLAMPALAVKFVDAPPLDKVVTSKVQPVKVGSTIPLQEIEWGGDIATTLANGNSINTASGSIFAQKNLSFKLELIGDIRKQLQGVVNGKYPFFRGTLAQVIAANQKLQGTPAELVVFYYITDSKGGDVLVGKPNIKKLGDMKGGTAAMQAYAPQMNLIAKSFKDAGVSLSEVKFKFTQDLYGETGSTPLEAFYEKGIDLVAVISPDAGAIIGGDDAFPGAHSVIDTGMADTHVRDVYAVRKDYLKDHLDDVIIPLVNGLLQAEQKVASLFKAQNDEYKTMIKFAAKHLLLSEAKTGDMAAMYTECRYAGYRGNVKFFSDDKWTRNFEKHSAEAVEALLVMGIITKKALPTHAMLDYSLLRDDLTGIDDVVAPRFNKAAVKSFIAKKQSSGKIEGEFTFVVPFASGSDEVNLDELVDVQQGDRMVKMKLRDVFVRVNELTETYTGAVMAIVAFTDPYALTKMMSKAIKRGSMPPEKIIKRQYRSGVTTSGKRAQKLMKKYEEWADAGGFFFDESQFEVVPEGYNNPITGMGFLDKSTGQTYKNYPAHPKSKAEWQSNWWKNRRAIFTLIPMEAESDEWDE